MLKQLEGECGDCGWPESVGGVATLAPETALVEWVDDRHWLCAACGMPVEVAVQPPAQPLGGPADGETAPAPATTDAPPSAPSSPEPVPELAVVEPPAELAPEFDPVAAVMADADDQWINALMDLSRAVEGLSGPVLDQWLTLDPDPFSATETLRAVVLAQLAINVVADRIGHHIIDALASVPGGAEAPINLEGDSDGHTIGEPEPADASPAG